MFAARGITLVALALLPLAASAQVQSTVARPFYGPLDLGTQTDTAPFTAGASQAVSQDGRYVVFFATGSLSPQGSRRLVRKDTATGAISAISNCFTHYDSTLFPLLTAANEGDFAYSISADGAVIAFDAASYCLSQGAVAPNHNDIWVRDFTTGSLARVSVATGGGGGNRSSAFPALSSDGRYVVFVSSANNLIANDTNGDYDVFVHDRTTVTTTRVSVATGGTQAVTATFYRRPTISADGRYVAFSSDASDLVAGDTNTAEDVFLHDRTTNQTTRISVDSGGVQANGPSRAPWIAANGTRVAFESDATNLTVDANGRTDVFVRDLGTGTTQIASLANGGMAGNADSFAPSLSADGNRVGFVSFASNFHPGDSTTTADAFVRDLVAVTTQLASATTGGSAGGATFARIAEGGQHVVLASPASTLVADDTNRVGDVFVRNLAAGSTTRASLNEAPRAANVNAAIRLPSVSDDGRFGVFETFATNIRDGDNSGKDVYWFDRALGTFQLVNVTPAGQPASSEPFLPMVSGDGRYVVFQASDGNYVAGDNNFSTDVFRRDVASGTTVRISTAGGLSPSISGDGRYVAYSGPLGHLFRWDAVTGQSTNILAAPTGDVAISRSGRHVVFASGSSSLVSGDTNARQDLFVIDAQTLAIERVSVGTGGVQGNGNSDLPRVSDDGRYVAFVSDSSNLFTGDTASTRDIFLRDRLLDLTIRIARAETQTTRPSLSTDGRYVAYREFIVDFSGTFNDYLDARVYDALTSIKRIVSVDALGRRMSDNARVFGSIAFPGSDVAISGDGATVLFDAIGSPSWTVYGGYRASENLFAASIPANDLTFRPAGSAPGGGDGNDYTGESIAFGGGWFVAGAPNGGPGLDGAGEVYIYNAGAMGARGVSAANAAKSMTLVATLRRGGGQIGDKFGTGVAISPDGGTIVVGAPLANGSGRVYLYRRPPNGDWIDDTTPDGTMAPNPEDTNAGFGASVGIDGGTILVGAPDVDVGNMADHGVAYAFTTNSVTRIVPSLAANARFGQDLAVDPTDGTLVIGAPGDGAGSAHLYRSQATGPLSQGSILPSAAVIGDKFGTSVAVDRGIIVIGAPGRMTGRGGATVFERPPGGIVVELAQLDVDALTGNGAGAGASVGVRNGLVLVGAPEASVDGRAAQGRVYVYEQPESGWSGSLQPDAPVAMPDGIAGDRFGGDVALGDGAAYVGVPRRDVETSAAALAAKALNVDQGAVSAFLTDRLFASGFE